MYFRANVSSCNRAYFSLTSYVTEVSNCYTTIAGMWSEKKREKCYLQFPDIISHESRAALLKTESRAIADKKTQIRSGPE